MSIQHRLYFKSCFICQTNEEGKWGLEPYDLASLVVINPIHRERNVFALSYPIPYHTPFSVWEGEFNALYPRRSWILLITVPHFLHQKSGAEAPLMILFPLSFYIRPLTNTKRMRSGST